MPLVNAYCSVDEVRAQMKDPGERLDTDLIEKAINASSRAADRWCSGGFAVAAPRRFWRDATATSRTFVADDPTMVWVEDFSTHTGLIVKTDLDGDGVFETTWTVGVDYQIEPLNGEVVAVGDTATPCAFWRIAAVGSRRWPQFDRRAGVQVTARFGWSAIPDEVNAATILKSVSLFMRKDAPFGVAGVNDFGPVRISRSDPDVCDLLSAYKKQRSRTVTSGAQRASLFHSRRGW